MNVSTKERPHSTYTDVEKPWTSLISELEQAGDHQTAHKMAEVADKWQKQMLHIGFCGLFSAGKSTLINAIMEDSLLPSSPIPTSANVVQVQYGSPQARVYFTSGEEKTLSIDDVENWKQYCRDGDEVKQVGIDYPHPLLEGGVQLLDTPGIDSTDERHQASTQEALHLADVVLFVADYHHVQSEHNFSFMKQLKERGKVVFLIINQMDKHNPHELSLQSFLNRVQEGLQEWGIAIDGIFCTSLKSSIEKFSSETNVSERGSSETSSEPAFFETESSHRVNQLPKLRNMLQEVKAHKKTLIEHHLSHAVQSLLGEHAECLRSQQEHEREELLAAIDRHKDQVEYDEAPYFLQTYESSLHAPHRIEDELMHESKKIMRNAHIMPYTTTQLALSLIESFQEDFKVGFLFVKKKTEEERQKRHHQLYEALVKNIQAQIDWHIKDLLQKKAEAYYVEDQDLKQELLEWSIEIPQSWLTDRIKQQVNPRQYVYTYKDELSARIEKKYLDQVSTLAKKIQIQLQAQHATFYEPLQERIESYQEIQNLQTELEQWDQSIEDHINQLQNAFEEEMGEKQVTYQTDRAAKQSADSAQVISFSWSLPQESEREVRQEEEEMDYKAQSSDSARSSRPASAADPSLTLDSASSSGLAISSETGGSSFSFDTQVLQDTARRYQQAAQQLRKVPSLVAVADEFEQKAQRFKNQRFRISLFGAFSAGKSSFANALLGEALLPVSPNPTTAAINYIQSATAEHPSRTAHIQLKRRERVEEEIHISLQRLHLQDHGDVDKNLRQVPKINPQHIQPALKPYYSFLQACAKGWEDIQARLGQSIAADEDMYQAYVAEEHKACFVQDIVFYHDSPLTKQGLELIDTPGADSIYARHTDVTFEFIKNSDAIIYLTYYNHAFSRADSQFLDQLGRVKDQFAMDKMFFVINARDLAADQGELEQVEQHVQESLVKSGIRKPRMFSVSALQALQGKGDAGFDQFQDAFFGFIREELVQYLAASAQSDLERGFQLLEKMQEELHASASVRQGKKENLLMKQKEWEAQIKATTYPSYVTEIEKEVHELFYYVKQRWDFSYRAHANDIFHPSVFGKNDTPKKQLQFCLDELLFRLGSQLKDEAQATALRLENAVQRLQQRAVQAWQHETEQAHVQLTGNDIEDVAIPMPSLASLEVNPEERKEMKNVFRHFKNPKQFFEQDGKKKLFAELEPQIEAIAERYVVQIREAFVQTYCQAWNQAEDHLREGLLKELHLAVRSRYAVLDGELSVQELDEIMDRYEKIDMVY